MKINKISKKAQEVKSEISRTMLSKKAQEEIIGFAIILVIIAIVAIIFISLSSNKSESSNIEDYEASSFIKAMLEQTTSCEINNEFSSVKEIIFDCIRGYTCSDGKSACDILNEITESSLKAGWDVSDESSVKGYEFVINSKKENLVNITKGKITSSYKASTQDYSVSGEDAEIYIKVYS